MSTTEVAPAVEPITAKVARERWVAGERVGFARNATGAGVAIAAIGDFPVTDREARSFDYWARQVGSRPGERRMHFFAPAPEVAPVEADMDPVDGLDDLTAVSAEIRELDERRAALVARRNDLIVAARLDRWPWAKLQSATGLNRARLDQIARAAGGGELPTPRQLD